MRDPSIHIKLSDFQRVLKEALSGINPVFEINYLELSKRYFKLAAPYSVNTRTVSVNNNRVEKKAKQLLQSSRLDSDQFSELVYAIRKSLKHQGIIRMKPSSKDWEKLKEVTSYALDFCNEFELSKKDGFTKYIRIGISLMNKFNISKFIGLNEAIYENYISQIEISADDDPDTTFELYKIYSTKVISDTGVFEELKDFPEKYVWFVRARNQAKELNVSLQIYMKAQFEGLDFTNGIPYPSQLVGPKATERVSRYLFKRNLKIDRD